MIYSIIVCLLFIAAYVGLIYTLVYSEAVLNHYELNRSEPHPPAGFMHENYMIRNILILLLVLIGVFHSLPFWFKWYYYLATMLTCILLYIPLHDGWYYMFRNQLKEGSYKGGFWTGVDTHPSSKLAKVMNEPTMRWLLLVLSCFLILFICTYEPFK
jgi:hypothetical protein